MNYEENQKKWIEGNRVLVTKVRITEITEPEGWMDIWVDRMKSAVGKTGSVVDTSEQLGVRVRLEDGDYWNFPYTSLAVVE